MLLEIDQNHIHEAVDMNKFKEEWEDQEIADNFDELLRQELKL